MKLTLKIALALLPVVLVTLALNTYVRVRREIALFQSDTRRDHHLIANVLRSAVLEVWRVEGASRALDLVRNAHDAESSVQIRWVWLDAPRGAPDGPGAHVEQVALRAGGDVVRTLDAPGQLDRLYTYAFVGVPGGRPGAIEISDTLDEESEFIRVSIRNAVIALLALTALGGGLQAALGVLFVGRPVRRLVDMARRVAGGQLGVRVDLPQRDEFGELAREMSAMSAKLAEANVRAGREAEERLRALDQLRHADRLTSVGKLASGLAHELGTPLNVVLGRARSIATQEVGGQESVAAARVIADQVERMATTIRQLLDFARGGSLRRAPEDVCAIVDRTVDLFLPLARRTGVSCDRRGEREPLIVRVDAALLQQAMLNLLVNAVQAMPDGGSLTIEVARARARPPDGAGPESSFLAIAVRDTGHGILEEHLPHVFEPFFTTKDVGEGTGLGLSVAWGIVREHGGWIGVESRPGSGSCFTIHLPEETS